VAAVVSLLAQFYAQEAALPLFPTLGGRYSDADTEKPHTNMSISSPPLAAGTRNNISEMASPLAIRRLHHVAVTTADPEASTAFYRDLLGFAEIPRPEFNFRGAWLYDEAADLQIHIIEHPQPTQLVGEIDTKTNHFAMEVDDLDAVEAMLKERGVEYVRQVNAGGYQQIFIRDPDGNHVELGMYPETETE